MGTKVRGYIYHLRKCRKAEGEDVPEYDMTCDASKWGITLP